MEKHLAGGDCTCRHEPIGAASARPRHGNAVQEESYELVVDDLEAAVGPCVADRFRM